MRDNAQIDHLHHADEDDDDDTRDHRRVTGDFHPLLQVISSFLSESKGKVDSSQANVSSLRLVKSAKQSIIRLSLYDALQHKRTTSPSHHPSPRLRSAAASVTVWLGLPCSTSLPAHSLEKPSCRETDQIGALLMNSWAWHHRYTHSTVTLVMHGSRAPGQG